MYRDNEVAEGHSLAATIAEIKENRLPVSEIRLNNFDVPRIARMLSELLLTDEKRISELADFIFGKSKGNPFFTLEIVRQLVNEEALVYRESEWEIDKQKLYNIAVSATILDILLKRIEVLTPGEKELLSTAAVIGRRF